MRQRGFTLLEMVVALAIFSIMAVIAYRGLTGILDAREALEQDSARLSRLTFAVALIERDVRQALPRPVRDELGDPEPALVGTVRLLALTRLGRSNPAQLAQASLERVEYGWADGTLRRIAWPVLDRAPNTEPQIQELISDLDGVQLRFLRGPDQWLDQWPPPAAAGDDGDGPEWPRAVELLLESAEFGVVRRTFPLVARPAPVAVPGLSPTPPADG